MELGRAPSTAPACCQAHVDMKSDEFTTNAFILACEPTTVFNWNNDGPTA